jgi:hypothetical protein
MQKYIGGITACFSTRILFVCVRILLQSNKMKEIFNKETISAQNNIIINAIRMQLL